MRGNTVNNTKLMTIAKIRETRTRFLQPTHSECKIIMHYRTLHTNDLTMKYTKQNGGRHV
jgi:hypothetical protein